MSSFDQLLVRMEEVALDAKTCALHETALVPKNSRPLKTCVEGHSGVLLRMSLKRPDLLVGQRCHPNTF